MSLITRCPACATLFKVVPDQLRISEGWVRCGQCDDVFDASINLLPPLPLEETSVAPPERPDVDFDAAEILEATPAPCDVDLDLNHLDITDEFSPPQQTLVPALPDDEAESLLPDLALEELSLPDDVVSMPSSLQEAKIDDSQFEPLTTELPASFAHIALDASEAAPQSELNGVSFLRSRKNTFSDRKPYTRAILILLSVSLVLGLSGQVVIHERDRIAAWQPQLKPGLQALCDTLSCTLSPIRRIESIVIDSSSFTKIRTDLYRLNFTLKNTASMALATPAIELTLTDSLDQPVIRRVFFPSELGGKSAVIAVGSEWAPSLVVMVKTAEPSDRVAGYRLLAFYP